MIVTTTGTIDGYEVKEYLGVVSGTDIYLVGGVFGGGLANQEKLFGAAMKTALNHLTINAMDMGADAVIGVGTSFTSPGSGNNMILALTGTAVKLKEVDVDDALPEL